MRSCETIREELPGFLFGNLPPDANLRVLMHTTVCRSCRAELKRLRDLDGLLREHLPSVTPSPDFTARFASRLDAQDRGERAPTVAASSFRDPAKLRH